MHLSNREVFRLANMDTMTFKIIKFSKYFDLIIPGKNKWKK